MRPEISIHENFTARCYEVEETDSILDKQEAALRKALDLLEFHEGSEFRNHEGAELTISVNAGDWNELLKIVRDALS